MGSAPPCPRKCAAWGRASSATLSPLRSVLRCRASSAAACPGRSARMCPSRSAARSARISFGARNALTDETGYSKPLRQIGSPDHLSFLLLHFPYLKYVCQFLTILNSTMKYNNIYFIYSSFKHYIFSVTLYNIALIDCLRL